MGERERRKGEIVEGGGARAPYGETSLSRENNSN